jgi:hypothetical protein
MTRLACALLLAGTALLPLTAQTPGTATGIVLFEGGRLITGDGRPAIENSAYDNKATPNPQVGRQAPVPTPDAPPVD